MLGATAHTSEVATRVVHAAINFNKKHIIWPFGRWMAEWTRR